MAENVRFQIDIGTELADQLDPIAEADHRTVTNLVRLILWEWLAARQERLEKTS
jgi:hypothetical protein